MAGRPSVSTPEEVWSDLKAGLSNVYRREPMAPKRYMELYSHVFNFCTSSSQASAASSPNQKTPRSNGRRSNTATHTNGSASSAGAASEFMGIDVYMRLKEFIITYVSHVYAEANDKSGEELLDFYSKQWLEYRFSSRVVDGIFAYLNRHWIKREMDEGNSNIYTIYTLALVTWRESLFAHLSGRITDAILELIRQDRCGNKIKTQLISSIIDSYVELGVEENTDPAVASRGPEQQSDTPLKVYKESFEAKFLDVSERFYLEESTAFMEKNPLTEYMKKVETRLNEEHDRCQLYLHNSTQNILAKCLENVLIRRQLEVFQKQFGPLLEARRDDDLGRMYKLCERVDNGLENLRQALQDHITREGLCAIEQVAEQAANDAKMYVQTILSVHERYAGLVRDSFNSEPGFMQSLDKAATSFINKNAVTSKGAGPNSSKRSPELLAKYCDMLLRKSSRIPEDSELENLLNQIMVVFKYIEDKDVFSTFYTSLFSKRLIHELSASEEAEMSLINKLKNSCGFEYTNRMSKMINDVQISKDLCTGFNEFVTKDGARKDLDFSIMVLSTGAWPMMPMTTFSLPVRLNTAIEQFKQFYDSKHNGRKLTWVFARSRGEVTASCFSTKRIFISTTAQLTVLMLFNDSLTFTAKDIASGLGMDKKTADFTIMSLVKSDLIKGEELGASGEYDENASFELNLKYTNKKIKVDISKMALRADTKQETEQVQKNVDDDRKNVINACIVRIMKTRKSLKHQMLITEVLAQLSNFRPRVELVKRCIGQLIEKEYLKRSDNERDLYEYVA